MEEIDLNEVFKTIWSKKLHIVVILILFCIVAVIYTKKFVVPEYTSSTTLILATADTTVTASSEIAADITLNSKLVATYSELIESKKILRQVQRNLGISIDEKELKESIDVRVKPNTEVIEISVTNKDTEMARDIANEIANVFKEQIPNYYNIKNIQIVDVAETSSEPSNINLKKNIVIFAMIGFVVACGYVLILNVLDNTVKSEEEVEALTELTVIATLPFWEGNATPKPKKRGENK